MSSLVLLRCLFCWFALDPSVPPELLSTLDGPKWAPPGSSRRGRAPTQEASGSAAPVKPRPRASSAVSANLGSSARRLFGPAVAPSSSTSPSSSEASFSGSGSDSDATPRPSRSHSIASAADPEHSFIDDFVPRTELFQELLHRGASLAGRAIAGVVNPPHSSSSPSSASSLGFATPEVDIPPPKRDPPPSLSPSSGSSSSSSSSGSVSPGPGPRHPPLRPVHSPRAPMATVLPLPKDINVKDVKDFDGTPADLSLFDTQVENALDRWDIPAYTGGCVSGDVSRGFEFVASTAAGVSNYRLGGKLCSGLCNQLTGAAAQWWDDYAKSGKPRPNCWKRATDVSFVPAGLVEVSLYDLLAAQFDPTVDAQQAELELDSFRWNPLDKKALGIVPFRGHVSRLCTRAGKTGWALRGKVIRNTFPDWLRQRVYVTKTEDAFWSAVEDCVNTELMDRQQSESERLRSDSERAKVSLSRSDKQCIFCGFKGHEFIDCRKMKAARAASQSGGVASAAPAAAPAPAASPAVPSSTTPRRSLTCYNCQRPGHISTFCPEPRRDRRAANVSANVSCDQDAPLYLNAPAVVDLVRPERVDEQETIVVGHQEMDLPLYHVLTQVRERREVFAFSTPLSDTLRTPTTVMHSFTRTPGGQDLFTIWDTAALLSLVPMSTVTALNLSYTPGSDVSFIVANGSRMAPVGYCTDMQFCFPEDPHRMFTDKVYVVDSAPFQLLLGVRFLHRHWAGVFLPWAKVILLKPSRVEIQGSLVRPAVAPPLRSELLDDLRLADVVDDESESPALVTVPMADAFALALPRADSALEVGKHDLVAELDGPVDFAPVPAEARVSCDFVRGIFKFGPSCPPSVVTKAVDLVLAHWDQFSWHEMDLGCISDVPYDTKYVDDSPCVCKSRRHNYAERNATIIEAKSRPLIDLGVYRRAGPDVVDRAQLVVVRTKPEDPMNLKFCRVAHDFRCKNDNALLVPVPMATRPELYSFLTRFQYFWKTDADRGFLQVVQAPSAVRHTGFELFHELFVSERMLFGQINGPSFFELNFNVMARDLKFNQKVVKNFFDDILGGSNSWEGLLASWAQLLQQARLHGWKFKPAKTEFGFEEIVAVGARYSGKDGTIAVVDKLVDAVRSLRYPRTVTEVRSLLGLFNQFRDRVPGYALRVQALTQLTRSKGDSRPRTVTMTVEAAEEFRAMQDYLLSPAVLVVFRHGWRTFVYTDASLGTSSTPGGLGAVITQLNAVDGREYVCAFASAGLTPAQRNYPPVRLEALAFIFVLSKFYDWLEMTEFTWRTDARAHKYITDNKLSPNPALARYFVGLQAFRYHIEWVPGLKLIADPLSRMVVVNTGAPPGADVALTTRSLLFGDDISRRLVLPESPPTVPAACALFTWDESVVPLPVDSTMSHSSGAGPSPVRCCTMVQTRLPPGVVADLVSFPDLPLTALPTLPSAGVPEAIPSAVEVGNVHTFRAPCYSSKDRGKLDALPCLRAFFTSGTLPSDPVVARWVRWLAKRLIYEDDSIWRIDHAFKLKVLEQPSAILAVLRELHDGFGHRALPGVYHHFKLRYWIPAAAKVIKQYIEGCSACQRLAAPNKFESPGYQLNPNDIFSHWSVDCIGPFPADPRTGDLHVIIAVDWLTRWAEAKAVNNIDADTCSSFLYDDICCRYGVPESLRSDHGRSFDNEVVEHLAELLRINHHMSTPYYPQSNGLVERLVQTFKVALRRSIQDQLAGAAGVDDEPSPFWSHLVPSTLFAYRTTPHSALGVSPAEVVFGRSLRLPGDNSLVSPPLAGESSLPASFDHKEAILQRLRFLTDVIPTLRAQPPPPPTSLPKVTFNVGDSVWVRDSKYDVGFPPVFAPRWKGPFFVKDRLAKNVYRLRTNPDVSGKRSTALALPINGSRLRLASAQELSAVVAKLQERALRDIVDDDGDAAVLPVSFVLPL